MIALQKGEIPNWVVANKESETAQYVAWRRQADEIGSNKAGTEPAPWQREDIKHALILESNRGKCVYCESHVVHVTFGDVEHCKPKSRFPEAVLDWENLGLACPKCNNAKLAQWSDDEPIVWPFRDEPSEHLSFIGPILEAKTARGRTTLEHVKLNRSPLVERRTGLIAQLDQHMDYLDRARPGHVEIVKRAILECTTSLQEFSALASIYLAGKGIQAK
jgi:5-methylcytosine-specific restriction endonuclease McrA